MKGLLLFCCLLNYEVYAQKIPQETSENNIFLELLGNGGYASINYERKVYQQNNISIYPSIGISTFKVKDFTGYINPDLILPVGWRLYYGSKHVLVFGLGQTLSSAVHLNTESFEPKRTYKLSANLMIGYRMNFNRINLQLAYTPILENYDRYINWLGLAVGYRF